MSVRCGIMRNVRHHLLKDDRLRHRGGPVLRVRLTSALIGALLSCALAGCTAGTPSDPAATSTAVASSSDATGNSAPGSGRAEPHGSPAGASGTDDASHEPPHASLTGRTIAVDPGHNGANGANPSAVNARVPDGRGGTKACNTVGASSDDGYPEHRFTWELAQAVETALTQAGADVILSRDSDAGVGPCVDERGTFADEADAMVSLHGNGTEDRAAHGFHVITAPAGGRADDEAAQAAEDLGHALAEALEHEGFERNPAYDDLVVRSDLATLNNASVPAVMLEAGEMRNAEDARVLASQDGQKRIAEAVLTALTAVLAESAP